MNKKNNSHAAAVIEIGTDNVRMRVSQLSKGSVIALDTLEYPISVGHDVFERGVISFDSLRELSSALNKFAFALQTYNIQKPKVISCTALRDAKNRSLVTDQLRVRNGLEVTVLEDSQEKAYLYGEILKKLQEEKLLHSGNTMIAFVGSGSIGVAVCSGGKVVYFQSIPMGSLKLQDVLQRMRSVSEDFHTVVEEYLDTVLNRISIGEFPIDRLVLTGSQIGLVAKLCGAKQTESTYHIGAKELKKLYRSLRSLTPESISLHYGVGESQASVLYTALAIYHSMLRFCPEADTVYSPTADISEAFLRCILAPKADAERISYSRESALACAETMARRFGCDLRHSEYLRECSCRIFDKLKKIHGLDGNKRLILELASILHSCGSFVSVRQHNRSTFELIKGMDLFGLSGSEVLEVAFVAGSIAETPSAEEDPDFARLSNREKLTISKLAAIFRMANALDKSHREKLKDLKVTVENDHVLFKASSSGDFLLEQWAFEESAWFFKDIFGLSPELSVKYELL